MKKATRVLALLLTLLLLLCACAPAESGSENEEQSVQSEEQGPEQAGQEPGEEKQPDGTPGDLPAEQDPSEQAEPGEQTPEPEKTERPDEPAPPAPEQKPGDSAGSVPDAQPKVTISIRCDTILEHPEDLDSDKTDLVPQDGVILAETEVAFTEGESVFDVLARAVKEAGVHMEYSSTPMYQSSYIEGIGNLYELDCGPLSGWMYRVNGDFPNYGCSKHAVVDGDVIEWVYTCDLGADVGGAGAFEGQQQ